MNKKNIKKRLAGIDLCRGFSAFAVILVHSGDSTWGVPVGKYADSFRLLFYFAVPFFLATSFHFSLKNDHNSKPLNLLFSRSKRILIPLITWTLIYIVSRSSFWLLSGNIEKFDKYIQDPISLFFLGGASYQLYFLPLILSGIFALFLIQKLRPFNSYLLFFLLISSFVCLQILTVTGNSFDLGPNTAFNTLIESQNIDFNKHPIMRILAVYFAMLLSCLPYIFFGIYFRKLLNKYASISDSVMALSSVLIIFLLLNFIGNQSLPLQISSLLKGFTLLYIGISISKIFKLNYRFIVHLGNASFGIYLIHPLIMNIVKILLGKTYPSLLQSITLQSMLIIALTTFLLSWLAVAALLKINIVSKCLFGYK